MENTTPPQPKNNSKTLVIFLSLLTTTSLFISGLLYIQNQQLKQTKVIQPEAQPTETVPQSNIDPEIDRKTYIDPDNTYTFKYPNDWKVHEQTTATGEKTGNISIYSPRQSKITGSYSIGLYIHDTNLSTTQEFMQDNLATSLKKGITITYDSQTVLMVSNVSAIKLNRVFAHDHSADRIFVLNDNKGYIISFPVGEENSNIVDPIVNHQVANQILSTFKFSDDPSFTQLSTKTVTNITPKDLAFESFKLTFPSSLGLKVNDTIINENNYVNETGSIFMILSKENSSLEIASAAFGGGACLFPGEEEGDWPFGRYGEFEDIRVDKNGIWRRSKSLNQQRPENEMYSIYTICHKKDSNQNYFNAFTPAGGIVYKIYEGEEDLIAEYDQIVKDIKILQ